MAIRLIQLVNQNLSCRRPELNRSTSTEIVEMKIKSSRIIITGRRTCRVRSADTGMDVLQLYGSENNVMAKQLDRSIYRLTSILVRAKVTLC